MRTTRPPVITPICSSSIHYNSHSPQKTRTPRFLRLTFTACLLMFMGCNAANLFYFPEELAQYLELKPDQQTAVMPLLQDIQRSIIAYYTATKEMPDEWREPDAPELSEEELEAKREITWAEIRKVADGIATHLTADQQKKLNDLPMPHLTFSERVEVSRRMLRMDRFASRNEARVPLTLTPPPVKPDMTPEQLWQTWTLRFGNRSAMGFPRGSQNPGFPLFIHATLMDPQFLTEQSPLPQAVGEVYPYYKDMIEIRITIMSVMHESFMELKNWIVYLETGDKRQVEMNRFEPSDQLWEKPSPAQQLMFPGLGTSLEWANSPGIMIGGGDGGGGYEDFIYSGIQRGAGPPRLQRKSFTLYFPAANSEGPVITSRTEELKLVFLWEVQSEERAEGTWIFR